MDSAVNILDTSQLYYEGDFDTQVDSLLNYVRLTASEVRNLRNVFVDLEEALQKLAPGLQVHPFGSIVTGLGIRTSDVDCFIALPYEAKPQKNYVVHARNILKRYYKKFTNVFAITSAKVPIVKFLHIPTNCNCDINFKSPAGVQNSELISFLLQLDRSERALRLAIIVKYWSKVHRFTGTNLLASYGLTLLVIFYLQLMNILPSIHDLQLNVPPYMIDNWNTAFDNRAPIIENNDSLYDLLGGFFKCYANMNFDENIISPYMGRLLNKQSFKKFEEMPAEFELYKHNLLHNMCKPLQVDWPICVQDPFEHSRNCAGTVHAKLVIKIRQHFQFAAQKFDELPQEYFLQAILTEVPSNVMSTPLPNFVKPPKHVFHNKVVKKKYKYQPKQHEMPKKLKIINCYEYIRNIKK